MLIKRPTQVHPTILPAVVGLFVLVFLFSQLPRSKIQHAFNVGAGPSNIAHHVFNETLGFEKIFVISLPSRTDRRDGLALAAAVSNIKIDFIDGVKGDEVPDKAIPKFKNRVKDGEIGCWRAHMNAIQRLKEQLFDFARSSNALTQPLLNSHPPKSADPTYPIPPDANTIPTDISFDSLPSTALPVHSPYGDNWGLLWIGHLGMNIPTPNSPSPEKIPRGRIVRTSDNTVPQIQHLKSFYNDWAENFGYENHTRVVHHATRAIGTAGYAVTQATARKLLYAVALDEVNEGLDHMLSEYCEGRKGGWKHADCLTTNPALLNRHRSAGWMGADGDIQSDYATDFREEAETDNVRWSTRLNMEVLLEGRTEFVDQWPDE
ncbi:hypothetical protein LOCC1_G002397 [Lachnellula occidentalis]|uniref:Glycosyl transferase family 25 domain-containing protein n=1 Tax=Lachnellula occidentalis TaxID=215460 RepID=A0A8H8S6M9_9HELO|nr:hypothetical protein LOCC1_G002397 [Lachnellula occidentalis]